MGHDRCRNSHRIQVSQCHPSQHALSYILSTPVVGLGCQSGSYLLYGLAATQIWLILLLAAYLSHRHSLLMERSPPYNRAQRYRSNLLAAVVICTRLVGKALAIANALFLVATSVLQFTGLYDTCWCNACIPSLGRLKGWVILFATDSEISAASSTSWWSGTALSAVSAGSATGLLLWIRTR